MAKPLFRWGILGTAQIARKAWQAIHLSGNGIVVAVASRNLARSGEYIAQCQSHVPFAATPRAVGSYEELIGSPDIDGVYIPLPTGVRKEWVLRAAAAGKHVVCEKPCATCFADLVEMTDACRRANVQFMDGVMFVHSRRMNLIRQVLDDGQTVGRVRRITSAFTFNAPEEFFSSNIRSRGELEPDGCVGDLGWYNIQIALWTMGWELPARVSGRLLSERRHPDGAIAVPTEFSGELFFRDGTTSGFYCSFLNEMQQWAHISGTRGVIQMPDFVLPVFGSEVTFETGGMAARAEGCDINVEPHWRQWPVNEYSNSHATAQETNLFRDFAEQAQSGRLNEYWPERALKTQRVMEVCLASARDGGRVIECPGF